MSAVNIAYSRNELEPLVSKPMAPEMLIPELVEAARNPQRLKAHPALPALLNEGAEVLAVVHDIPQLTYTMYRDVQRKTARFIYERPFHARRARLAAAALQVLLGNDEYLNPMYDLMWAMCEESVWIVPQREDLTIDLRTAATIMDLSEICVALANRVEDRIIERVKAEIERRVFCDYLENYGKRTISWHLGTNNWNGVCNGGVGAAFLLLEEDPKRLALALEIVLEGLNHFLATAFEEDGTSSEGVGYWQYGLSNFIAFSEMLRIRTEGAIDLLDNDRVREICQYPTAVMLSPGKYFAFSDCNEENTFNAGLMARLSERAGAPDLLDVIAGVEAVERTFNLFHTVWRSLLWWDGTRRDAPRITDVHLPGGGVTRLVSRTADGIPVVLAAKAGHNGVPHNHNDVGTFVLHVDGETLLCDPERGLYDNYKKFGHDNVLFSNSYGHSVPVIGGRPQSKGAEYAGEVTAYEPDEAEKRVEMELAGAYEFAGLTTARRVFRLQSVGEASGELVIEGRYAVSSEPIAVEEVFVTWHRVLVRGARAVIVGERRVLELLIEEPANAVFGLEIKAKESEQNDKPVPLKRLAFTTPEGTKVATRVRVTVLP